MTNKIKKNNINELAEIISGFTVIHKKISLLTFRTLLQEFVICEDTAEKFEKFLKCYSLDLNLIDKEDYYEASEFFAEFNYDLNEERLIEDGFQYFANAKEIEKFGMSIDDYDNEFADNYAKMIMACETHLNPIGTKF